MKIIEQAGVITGLIDTAKAIRTALDGPYTIGVVDTDTGNPRVLVAITDIDGNGGYIGVTLTGAPELVTG